MSLADANKPLLDQPGGRSRAHSLRLSRSSAGRRSAAKEELENLVGYGDELAYDLVERPPSARTKLWFLFGDFANMLKAFIGSNYLSLPFAIRQGGIIGSVVGIVVLSVVVAIGCDLMVQCKRMADGSGAKTYGDVGYFAYGKAGRKAVDVVLFTAQLSFGVGYLIFLKLNVHALFHHVPEVLVVWVCAGLLWGLSSVSTVRKLAPTSVIANVTLIVGLALVFQQEADDLEAGAKSDLHMFDIVHYPMFLALLVSSLEGTGLVIPIESSMASPKHLFSRILWSVIGFVAVMFIAVGVLGYMVYGNDTVAPVTLNIACSHAHQSIGVKVVLISLCIGIFFTYPMQLFPCIDIVSLFVPWRRALCALPLVLTTATVASVVDDFGAFIAFVSALTCPFLAIIFPCMFALKLDREMSMMKRRFLWICIVLGVIVIISGTATSLNSLLHPQKNPC